MNDGLEVDAWLEIMEWRGTIDRMVAFFYNSFAVMVGHASEFFGLQQEMYNSCGVSVN